MLRISLVFLTSPPGGREPVAREGLCPRALLKDTRKMERPTGLCHLHPWRETIEAREQFLRSPFHSPTNVRAGSTGERECDRQATPAATVLSLWQFPLPWRM
jgi:hypothetical protein